MQTLDLDRQPPDPPEDEPRQRSFSLPRRLAAVLVLALLVAAAAAVGALGGLLFVYSTDLPQVGDLERFRPYSITELYDDEGRVIGSFALQRRVIAQYGDFSPLLIDAVLSIEDKEFFHHWGVNFWRVLGAAYRDIIEMSRVQGASTLTMQLSRNLFLTPDRTFGRKFQEVLLSIQIERRFTKPQIFTMYANQIYLGHGVYGFEAGARYYFGKPSKDLTLEEATLLAGLPQSPNNYSPIVHPERALRRRNLVINAMLEDGKITAERAAQARESELALDVQAPSNALAPYFVEEVRRYLENKYGSHQVHQGALRVYTSLNLEMQMAANRALLDGLAAYERRHGWKGGLLNVAGIEGGLEGYFHPDWNEPPAPGRYMRALVTAVAERSAALRLGRHSATLSAADMAWTRRTPAQALKVGDIAYVRVLEVTPAAEARVALEQDTGAQGALVVLDNATGDIKAMVGGRDFETSKFNRATQALRQVGSAFKPYVYTAALDLGASPDDVVLDAPVTFPSPSGPYTPRNYDRKFEGHITLRRALAQSRNIPTLKLADSIGMERVLQYVRRFGVTAKMPTYLPVALGSGEITLLEQTAAFTTFPNDGVRVAPRYIRKVTTHDGRVLEENFAEVRDVVKPETARAVTSMLRGVVLHGTARAAAGLKPPVAGKTGTTSDYTDAWFVGFSPSLTAGVWIGFDEKKTLGNNETGARAALPVWVEFMKAALRGREDEDFVPYAPPPERAVAQRRVDTADHAPGDGETEQ
jgi:penicillin-binding protein 1A